MKARNIFLLLMPYFILLFIENNAVKEILFKERNLKLFDYVIAVIFNITSTVLYHYKSLCRELFKMLLQCLHLNIFRNLM